jgi:uncharacterized protein YqjF (DUF2071 family)
MAKIFLTAHWGNLLLLNYASPPQVLAPYLPPGWELDLFQGSPFVSLVAFNFTRTKVFGIQWPLFTDFPEVNLRFYVRREGKRGVCFVREFVPSGLVSGIANLLYNEPYAKALMRHEVKRQAGLLYAETYVKWRGATLDLSLSAEDAPITPEENSLEHFFKEHDLGVGHTRNGLAATYGVEHPIWRVFPVKEFKVRLDPMLYGENFRFLAMAQPDSVVFAEGSEIKVLGKVLT